MVIIRKANIQDIPKLVYFRRMMFESMGFNDEKSLIEMEHSSTEYFNENIPLGQFLGWMASNESNEIIGCGGLVIDQHPPSPSNLSGKVGYIMNIVTEPSYRKKGVATIIMDTIMQYLTEKSIKVVSLHTTEMGRSIYEKAGFEDSNEMKKWL